MWSWVGRNAGAEKADELNDVLGCKTVIAVHQNVQEIFSAGEQAAETFAAPCEELAGAFVDLCGVDIGEEDPCRKVGFERIFHDESLIKITIVIITKQIDDDNRYY